MTSLHGNSFGMKTRALDRLNSLRYDLTDTAGVLENKVLSMFHGLDDYSVLVK